MNNIGRTIGYILIILGIATMFGSGVYLYNIQLRADALDKDNNITITKLSNQLKDAQKINDDLYEENKILANEIVLRQDITSVIIDAARSYNIDPMLFTKLIKSESAFRPNPKHALPHVVGPCGINKKVWKPFHNPDTYTGNIYAGAEILSHYLEDSDSLTLALTRYKGFSKLGYQQAQQIIKDYYEGSN